MDRELQRQLLDGLDRLTTQVARVAFALEAVITSPGEKIFFAQTCKRCGCQLVPQLVERCPVCSEVMNNKSDASEGDDHGNRSETG